MNEQNLIEFINEKPSSNELYDLKFSERVNRFYIERYTNNFKLFFKNIKNVIFFLNLIILKKKIKSLSNQYFIKKFLKDTGFSDFNLSRLIQLKELIIKKKPKKILELGSGVSTVFMSYLINDLKLNCKIYSYDNDNDYINKIIKNSSKDILNNIIFKVHELTLFKFNNRRFIKYNNDKYIENIDILYVDGPVLYKFKNYENIKYTKCGDIIEIFKNVTDLPKTIVLDKKYDLHPTVKNYKKYKSRFNRITRTIIYEKI